MVHRDSIELNPFLYLTKNVVFYCQCFIRKPRNQPVSLILRILPAIFFFLLIHRLDMSLIFILVRNNFQNNVH